MYHSRAVSTPGMHDNGAPGLRNARREPYRRQRDSEKRFRALIEKSSDGIALFTAAGAVLYASPAIGRILGYEIDDLLGRSVFEWMHPDDLPSTTRLLTDLAREPGASVVTECRNRHKDGSWRWM